MATLDMWAYNIRNIARAGLATSDDERLGIRQIKMWIQGYRADAIKRFTEAGKDIDPQLISDFGIITLTEIDEADAEACQDIEWGCTIKKFTLPKMVDLPQNRAILFVGKIDKQTMFQRDEANVHYFVRQSRYGNLISRYFIIGQTVYVRLSKKDEGMLYINARGVAEDPSTLTHVVTAQDGTCTTVCYNDATDEYPLPMSYYPFIVKSILTTELGFTLQTADDLLNNAQGLNLTQNEIQANQP